MKGIIHRLALYFAALVPLLVSPAKGATVVIPGDTLVSNLGSATQAWDTVDRDPVATMFRIGGAGVLVTGIRIRMFAQSKGPDLAIRIASNIYDSYYSIERPDSTVGTFVSSPLELTSSTRDFYFPSSVPFILSAQSSYWVEVDGSDTSFSAVGVWHGGSAGLVNSGIAGESLYERIRGSFTDSYQTAPTNSFMAFELLGNIVPEPNSILTTMVGMAAIGLRRSRRNRGRQSTPQPSLSSGESTR